METEVHTYCFSIAANVLLSFFPFLIVMVSICHHVLHWQAAESAIYFALSEYFPDAQFIGNNLRFTSSSQGPFQIASVLLLLFTANGIFEPLEVALNRIWSIPKNRSFLRNQLVSMALIFACGTLALLSITLTALNREFLTSNFAGGMVASLLFKLAAIPVSTSILFLIYWKLPNTKIEPARVLPVAMVIGLVIEAAKNINLLIWPWLSVKLGREYGPFQHSAALILWSFLGSMIVLAGAEWTARPYGREAASK